MNGHILIVEDESVNAAVIEHQLTKLGYSIAGIVDSGEDALEAAEKTRPDLVLMDIQLEGKMDGIEAATEIQKRVGIPVVYLTANSDDHTIERARKTEAFGYLHKPFQEREVHSTLQLALYKAEMESRVRAERKWFATTLRCIKDGVITADAAGAVKLLNLSAEQLTGWKETQALDRDLSEVFRVMDPNTRQPECVLTRLIREEIPTGGKSRKLLISRSGEEVAIEESATFITGDAGEMIGVLVAFHECSDPR